MIQPKTNLLKFDVEAVLGARSSARAQLANASAAARSAAAASSVTDGAASSASTSERARRPVALRVVLLCRSAGSRFCVLLNHFPEGKGGVGRGCFRGKSEKRRKIDGCHREHAQFRQTNDHYVNNLQENKKREEQSNSKKREK